MDTSLRNLSNELAALTERFAPRVVAVHGRRHTPSSGVHWRENLIVTAEHALRRDEDIQVTLPAGEAVAATLVGRDAGTDVAVLRADALSAPSVPAGPDDGLRVGELALVVGRSPNSGPNASLGVISAVSGPWRTWRGGQLSQYLRLDATVYPGSSGGAVVDCRGRIIGVATSALSRVAGLAVPASTVDRVIDALLERGTLARGYLGVGLHPVPVPEAFRKSLPVKNGAGTMVLSVEPGGPAEKAGIILGDILLEIGGTSVEEVDDVQSLLGWERVGKAVSVRLVRGGELREIAVTVGERPRKSP